MTEEINEMINKFCDSVEKRINQYELEKENAELKDYSQRMENQRENYYKEYLRLKQENKELEEAYNEISNNSEILHENHCLRIANAKLNEDLSQAEVSMREWREQSLKYKSALEEIRKIAKDAKEDRYTTKSEDYTEGMRIIGCYVLNKINEVLN